MGTQSNGSANPEQDGVKFTCPCGKRIRVPQPGMTVKCPKCGSKLAAPLETAGKKARCPTAVQFIPLDTDLPNQPQCGELRAAKEALRVTWAQCPNAECSRPVVTLRIRKTVHGGDTTTEHVVWPISGERPVPPEVPEHIAADYKEATLVLNLSPKASAALSRRCLQAILREAGSPKEDKALTRPNRTEIELLCFGQSASVHSVWQRCF